MEDFIQQFEHVHWTFYFVALAVIAIIVMFIQDINNKKQTIKHNFPVVGRLRYLLESVGPELRQYIVANNRDELPFNRGERTWIYASAKQENNYQGFGTDKDLYFPGHIFINPDMFPYRVNEDHINYEDPYFLPCAKVMGEYHKRRRPFRPYSIVNVSAMSFGSLSAQAVEALNKGSKRSGCWHNTGEGSLSPYHRHGSDVVFHFGTGYFGCRNDEGGFSMEKLVEVVEKNPFVRAIEVKLSQGAKPGKGGVLPAKKITAEIAQIRGLPMGKDVLSVRRPIAYVMESQLDKPFFLSPANDTLPHHGSRHVRKERKQVDSHDREYTLNAGQNMRGSSRGSAFSRYRL